MRKFNAKNLRREVQKQLKELRGGVGRKTEGQLKIEKVAFEREQRLLASSAEHSDFNGVNGELKINSNDYDTSIESKSKNDEGLTISGEGLKVNGDGQSLNPKLSSLNSHLSSLITHSFRSFGCICRCTSSRRCSRHRCLQPCVRPRDSVCHTRLR